MCFSPQRRALFQHLNFQKWSEPLVLLTFWLRNVLRATTACTFSTSQLPKVVRTWCVFPTCQVRVVRFYHSCSPPPRLAILLLLLPLLLRQHLLHHLCLHFHVHCCLANSSPSSLPTSELSVHRWTSTWDLPSSVGTAGPQPGTFPAQWAPLDLNLGPAQLSVHRWTSTWDLPSSVCIAGRQPGTCPAQCAPLDLNGQIECQKICQIECQIECQKICQIKCHEICQIECQKICQIKC